MAVTGENVVVSLDAPTGKNVLGRVALFNEDGTAFTGSAPVAATASTAGVVKQAVVTPQVAADDAVAAAGTAPTKAEFDAVVTLANELKEKLNDVINAARDAGQAASS